MSGEVEIEPGRAGAPSDRLAPLWWLWGPLVAAVFLAIVPNLDGNWYKEWVTGERRGVLEAAQALLALAGFIVALRTLMMAQLRPRPWLYLWVGFAAAACFYIAGEEASWGQHYFGWSTPEDWKAINDQSETNLHNVSSWFDQKPRIILEIGVLVGGILIPLLAQARPAIRHGRFGLILPPLLCLPAAVLAEFARFWGRVADFLGSTFHLFGRSSEVQELYFYLFVLLYLIVLRRRLIRLPGR